jgi:hypothetical protein
VAEGLLDFLNSPGGMGLLSAVGAGLAGARRGGTWNAVGSGLLGGVQGYAQGQYLQRQNEYATQRGKLFDMQAQQLEAAQAAAKAEAESRAKRQGYLSTIGQYKDDFSTQQNQFDPTQWLRLGGSIEEAQKLAGMKDWGAPEVARTLESQDAQGNKITLQFDKFGRPVGDGVQGYTAPVQVDLGGRVQFVKPQAGVNLTKTMTPGEAAANARAREAAARDALSVTYQQDAEGNFVALPTKVQPGSMVRGLPVVSGPGMSPLKGAQKDAKLTESESKATLYLGQMRAASQTLNQLQSEGKTADPWQVAMTGGIAGNMLTSANAQQIGQAQNQWSEAYLRQKTGAAATKQEIDLNNRTFFPQVGDSPAVIKQKADMRAQVEQGMEIPAGRGASKLGGAPAGGPKFLGFE